jgi:hypothetical protein
MKKQKTLAQSTLIVGLITLLILSVPLIAMQFTEEVNWSPFDFIIIGMLLFGTGFSYMLILRYSPNFLYRAAVTLTVGGTFLMIWANLAVGLIGDGPNPGNLMYLGVLAVLIIGTFYARFTAKGMERTVFAAAVALVIHAGIALMAGMQYYPNSSLEGIIGVNAFFAVIFSAAGLLFRFISVKGLKMGAAE